MRETSTDYANPYRPIAVRAANVLGRGLAAVGLPFGGALTVDALVAAARRKTSLHDFGDEDFRAPLELLLRDLEAEARLSPVGRLITRFRLLGMLSARLCLQAYCDEHPELRDDELEAPVVIVGLPRTGTTMLHRLLAADPSARSIRSWEALNPAPLPGTADRRQDPRIAEAARAERALRFLAPDFFAVHPVEAEGAEEEVVLLEHTGLSTVPEASWHVPTYARWLEDQDQTPAYTYLALVLQVLQHQERGAWWVLKTPHHLEWLDVLHAVFPDAKVVQTHRDPQKTVPSFASMIAHGRGIFSDHVDPHEVGRHWLRKIDRMVSRAMAARDHLGDLDVLDVAYEDLMVDPMGQVERIYAFAGRELTPHARAAMEASRQVNRQHRHGRHVYRLADFGLTAADIEDRLGPYRARYEIPRG